MKSLQASHLRRAALSNTHKAVSGRANVPHVGQPKLYRMVAIAAGKTVSLGIEGMMCGGCTSRVENVLKGLESVAKVDVSLENKSATIELTDAASITADQLATLVKDLGFEVQLKS